MLRRLRQLLDGRFRRARRSLNCVVLDVETGGTGPATSALLSVGAVLVHDGEVVNRHEWHLIPDQSLVIDPEAAKINGWTGHPRPWAVTEAEFIGEFNQFVDAHPSPEKKVSFLGHNVWFDRDFIGEASRRTGIKITDRLSYRSYDTCAMAAPLELEGVLNSRQLDVICREFGMYDSLRRGELGHKSPLADCDAALAVFYEMLRRYT